jgi:hypothetical protein
MRILTEGGAFALLYGSGMLAGRADGGSLSNRRDTNQNTSSIVRATQNEELIRSRVSDNQQQ